MKKRAFYPVITIVLTLLTVFSVSAYSYNNENSLLKQNKDESIVLFNSKNQKVTLYKTDLTTDLNGDGKCSAADARELLRIASSLSVYNGKTEDIDIDMNGKITSADARLALRFSAKLDDYYTDSALRCNQGFYSDPQGNRYYFSANGRMAKDEKIDGIYFGKDGKAQTADATFFNDAIFIGDSVSVKLASYHQSTKCFGNATMCAASSLSAANSLWKVSSASVHPYYNGRKTLVEDCVKLSGKKKVFIMLGMNDIGIYSHDASIRNYKELVARIKAKTPDADIYVQSMTLMTSISERADSRLNNTQIKAYNKKLRAMCEEMGWHYLDVASATSDSTGSYLPTAYCSDPVYMGIHFTNEGCRKWVEYLYNNVLSA
ncbi:MAG: hypothetical protein IKW03_06365 [Clostridia bacterium]|nr:hypothetical protein [Clostridia bacterium]